MLTGAVPKLFNYYSLGYQDTFTFKTITIWIMTLLIQHFIIDTVNKVDIITHVISAYVLTKTIPTRKGEKGE